VRAWPLVRFRLRDDDVPIALIFVVLAAFACVTPVKNDTWTHLRMGHEMWQTGSLLVTEKFSYTSFGNPLNNHWWLTQLAFFTVYSLGGSFALTIFAGLCALAATIGAWRLMRGPWEARVALLGWLALASTPGWGIRPQVVSLAFIALMAHLIARDRLAWLPLVCVVWANTHALVIIGIAMAGALVMESLIWSPDRLRRTVIIAMLCAAAPVLTPAGVGYWREVFTTVAVSRALSIEEYRMPLDAAALPFWGGVVALVGLVAVRWKAMSDLPRPERGLIVAALIMAVAGVTAARNASIFAVVAAPALSWLLPPAWDRVKPRLRSASPAGYGIVALAAMLAAIWVWQQWQSDRIAREWQPLSSGAIAAVRACPDPMFNQFGDGAYLMWVLPQRRVFVDGRIEAYSRDLLQQSRAADVFGVYDEPFQKYGINCAVVATDSPMFERLTRDSRFDMAYSDPSRSVFTIRSRGETR